MILTAALADLLHLAPHPEAATRAALTRVLQLVGPALATASGFERRLATPVASALHFCATLVEALPGPVAIDRQAFASDPLVHALFATAQDIEQMLGLSQALRDHLDASASPADEYVHALLATRRREKHILGMSLQGDTLRREVPQTLLYFTDHSLMAVAAAPAATRERLRGEAFDSLLKAFAAHVGAIRAERQQLRNERDLERAQPHGSGGADTATDGDARARQLTRLDAQLRSVSASLQPDLLVDTLAAFLLAPEESLRLEPVEVQVDRMGVVASGDNAANGSIATLGFPELVGRDRRRYVVMLARFRRDEALRAISSVHEAQRRMIII